MLIKLNSDKALKSMMFNLIVRCRAVESEDRTDVVYEQYLKDLYWFNAGKGKKLGSLYSMVEKGVAQWCGSDEDGNLCLEEKRAEFSIFENV